MTGNRRIMSKTRITIMIDADLLKKLRLRQANLLKKSTKSVSLSAIINQILQKRL